MFRRKITTFFRIIANKMHFFTFCNVYFTKTANSAGQHLF